ncbi:unnamed protein product [Cyprideis torosa]|uniref:Uncharacterized protein n=1 Tax=Cyprideis torosa TaxID=163714 RepID=A0A7R8WLT4_9CRUS|nr:unnamed protein product [Cyprideis torosa]CAG0904608.1 unnamed protein product [Cyprideis torosa]
MPIVKSSNLPTYDRLIGEGRNILELGRANTQDIRALHIGFLNLMPDAALQATERQWFRLIGESNRVTQIYIHPFTLPVIKRGEKAADYLNEYYEDWDTIKNKGLDALIVTGANMPVEGLLNGDEGWNDLREIYQWAYDNVCSTICSCFASYALMAFNHDVSPIIHDAKQWGVYPHYVLDRAHPLTRGINTKMDVCHSRWGGITKDQYESAAMTPLIESRDIGVHMSVSKDGFRHVCFQGHPEYDTTSLLKEYRREITRFKEGELDEYPPIPTHYFGPKSQAIIEDTKKRILNGEDIDLPEQEIEPLLENTWTDSARSIMANWVGHVYQTTHVDRQKQFMDGIDPNNPLGI